MKGTIFNIQRFCDSDGPGIRTVVFFKGCPLSCMWCHNPESKTVLTQIVYSAKKCIACGLCALECPGGCHTFGKNGHIFDRTSCIGCMKCVDICPSALARTGYGISTDELIEKIAEDEDFYKASGGGVTFSGGEVYLQHGFLLEMLKRCKARHINTCVETSGFTEWENIEKTIPYTDLFLYDWKISDPQIHEKYTGVSNVSILANLEKLNKYGAHIVLRCPLITGVNDDETHLSEIARLAEKLENVERIDILPYHDTYIQKAFDHGIGVQRFPVFDNADTAVDFICKHTRKPVKKG